MTALEDHERRVRSAAQLLNDVVDAAERGGFVVWLALSDDHGASRRISAYHVQRRVRHFKAPAGVIQEGAA